MESSVFVKFLEKHFANLQKKNPRYSIRAFAKKLDMNPSTLNRVLSGKRAVTLKMAEKIFDHLDIPRQTRKRLFLSLAPNLEKSTDREENYTVLAPKEAALLGSWVHYALLALLDVKEIESDPAWLAIKIGANTQIQLSRYSYRRTHSQ